MRALKGLVIVLGVLVVAGMGVLAYGLYQKVADPGFRFFAGQPAEATGEPGNAPPPRPRPAAFGTLTVPLPEGCAIARVIPEGERVYLRIGPAGPCERVVVVDVAGGAVLGTILVHP